MSFSKVYASLNAKQKEAVDAIDGPVMVIAGPGTGKTQLLSVRVANILSSTDTSPESVLCLTFTNKAAANMRERLTEIIGPDARKVVVKTFHSFAAEIMNQYPDEFWNGARLTTVPDSVQLDIIESILKSLPIDNPLSLTFAGQFTSIGPVKNGLKLAKEAGLTPEKLKALINANLAYIDLLEPQIVELLSSTISNKKLPDLESKIAELPPQELNRKVTIMSPLNEVILNSLKQAIAKDSDTNKATHTSKWKSSWIKSINGEKGLHDERKRNNWWLALSDVYDQYRNTLHERGFYDYSDMLVEVISQMEQNEDLRSDIQERFLYVLIDEFQDTNPAQMRLAHLVSDHITAKEQPNIMVVGDDDQSIYKFNGAELNNMLNFRHDYKVKNPIVLEENYRSSQDVLDASRKIIEQADDRLVNREQDIEKNLVAVNGSELDGTLKHTIYETEEHQFSSIAKKIADLRSNGISDIAILARNHSSLLRLAHILQKNDVPVNYEKQSNVMEHEAVNQIILLARLIIAIQDGDINATNALLAKILRHPAWEVAATSLWKLAIENRSKPDWLSSISNSGDERLKSFHDWVQWLVTNSDNQPLNMTVEHLIGLRESDIYTSNLKKYYLSSESTNQKYIETLAAVSKLRYLTSEFSRHNVVTLRDLIRLIDVSKDNSQIITNNSPLITGRDAVQLLTVHKAKGLEFDCVFVVDVIEDNWKPKNSGRKPPANLPLQPYGDNYDDYIRLLYVATTRAKSSLYLSSYKFDHAGNDVIASPLIHDVLSSESEKIDRNSIISILEENVEWPDVTVKEREQLLRPLIDNFSLSPTTLIHFLDVPSGGPLSFVQSSILRVPAVKSNYQFYGTAIHNTLEQAQILKNKGTLSQQEIISIFSREISSQQLTRADKQIYEAKGIAALNKLFIDYGYALPKDSKPEQNLTDIIINNRPVSGKVDRIDFEEEKLTIIDYKTGGALSSFNTKNQQLAIKAWKHKLQLIYYSMLIKQIPIYQKYNTVESQMVYVEADSPNKLILSYQATEEDIERLQNLVSAVWNCIEHLNFPDTSGYALDISGIEQFEQELLNGKFKTG